MDSQDKIDAGMRREVVEKSAQALLDFYVFADVGQKMSDALRNALESGDYDSFDTPAALCERLTSDLQAICHDKHVRVRFNEEARTVSPPATEPSAEELAAYTDMARRANFGFYRVERLAGNIGYLDLRNFWDPGWDGAGDAAVGAMGLLNATESIIFDLRQNGGGSPAMVALLISYLVGPEPVHLNSFYDRAGDKTTQTWTLPYVPGRRMPDKTVYILTSSRTFSGAEEFSYNLKNMKRATIIGETTGGGAHPGGDIQIMPHFRVFVPDGRAINPISGTNWEGTGVEPDIKVPQQDALKIAHKLALEAVLKALGDNPIAAAKAQAEEARAALTELES